MNAVSDAPRLSRSGSENRQRSVNLTVRLSQDERAQLAAEASAAGLSLGSFVRWKLSGGAAPRSVRRPPLELEALRQLLGQLGKVGSNLNQIAHQLNAEVPVMPADLKGALIDVRALRDAVLASLGYEVDA